MKLLTFNVNNDYRDTENKAKIILNVILDKDIDIAGLQEVTPEIQKQLLNQITARQIDDVYCLLTPPKTDGFFNALVVKSSLRFSFSSHTFRETKMNRGFLMVRVNIEHEQTQTQTQTPTVFITTHLESGPPNAAVRQAQCKEILDCLSLVGCGECRGGIVFGDFNFCDANETFPGLPSHSLIETNQTQHNVFSYDCMFNREAVYPFRTNLDRFYWVGTNDDVSGLRLRSNILTDITVSDHFPVYLEF